MKRTRLKRESDRHRSERDERRDLVMRVHARDRYCVAEQLVPDVKCAGPLDVDEIIPRSSWRAGYLVDSNCQLVCRAHHDWKHFIDPRRARELGLLK